MVQLKDELLTVAEAAKLLKVTRHTIYRWITEGRLPAARYSRRVIRLRREDLDRVKESGTETSGEQPPQNWAQRLAPFMGIMTKEEANTVFGAIMEAREQSKSDPH
jgi:excisionase family DNA binding protein